MAKTRIRNEQITSESATDGYQLTADGSGGADWEEGGDGTSSLIFSQVVDVTVANSTSETTLLGAGRGSKTIPADTLDVGSIIRVTLHGYLSTTSTPNLTVKATLGGSEVATTGAVAMNTVTTEGFKVSVDIVCRSTGATGSVVAGGMFEYEDDSQHDMVKTSATTVDTTGGLAVSITVTWGTADAGNTITCQVAAIELLQADNLAVAAPSGLSAAEV